MLTNLDTIRRYIEDGGEENERLRDRKPRTFSFVDFDEACEALLLKEGNNPSVITQIPDPEKKALNNHLTKRVINLIKRDMRYFAEVDDYIAKRALEDETFPERVRDCFLAVYDKFAGANEDPSFGDDLYFKILDELTVGKRKRYHGAISVMLSHYFAKCEVFPLHPGEEEVS